MTPLQADIERRLAAREPDVEVLLAEVVGGSTLRVFIDHPDGVTLGLCERVSHELSELREQYSLEVSSPGRERPLTKPAHFQRFVGRRARVRLRNRVVADGPRPAGRRRAGPAAVSGRTAEVQSQGSPTGTRSSFTGELVGASDQEVTLAADGGVIAIPYSEIRRSNLVEE